MGIFRKIPSLFQTQRRLDVERRFEVMREAISGTMSNFYVVRDRISDQVVGLKIGDAEKVELFESRFRGLNKPTEGEIALVMRHPRIVETYECGLTTKGLHYVVMEYLKGPGLQMLVHNQDPILEGKRVRLIRQMAEALQYVHDKGYIHRDICPRNFICRPDAETLKLIDFGLTLPDERPFRQPGNRTGTPLYMAPEVIRRRWTDKRLDIFSFGVTAYQVCTYRLPWPGAETTGLAALAHDTITPQEILQWRPTLNKTLARAIMRCLAAEPDQRTASMEVFLRQIATVEGDDD